MKKSDATKIIANRMKVLPLSNDEAIDNAARDILEDLIKAGLTPPRRHYLESYTWKEDNTWEKES